MKYEKLTPDELNAFMRGYSRAEEIAKMFCTKYGSIYTYYELKILPYESCFMFRLGLNTSGIKLCRPVDYVKISLITLIEDGKDLEATIDFAIKRFKENLAKEEERLKSSRCDKCGRGEDDNFMEY